VLPFVFLDESKLGPFHPYGIAAALGFFAWDWALMREGVRRGFTREEFRVFTVWLIVFGAFFASLIDALFYHPLGPSLLVAVFSFQGLSSTGAMLGAAIGAACWKRWWVRKEEGRWRISRREKPVSYLAAAEVVVATWPIAFAFGRLGCSLIHDHPGLLVPKGTFASMFALAWPLGPEDGVDHVLGPLHVVTGGSTARLDLGFIELVVLVAMAIFFARLWKKDLPLGTFTILGTLIYGPVRFALDFLRETDLPNSELRHGGLTFAQYWSLAVIGIGLALLVKRWRGAPAPAKPTATVS